jgi:alkanesulfonate monooxygenase SsuD/methylene tetrahydromethanopterin reductase-like flavin-dependent oxidoreductase (luciferase family)
MTQIGAAPKSSLKALEETVNAVRQLLRGDLVTTHGTQVNLDQVQMQLTPTAVPPLYVGAMRDKSLRLAGRIGDGTILTGCLRPPTCAGRENTFRLAWPKLDALTIEWWFTSM